MENFPFPVWTARIVNQNLNGAPLSARRRRWSGSGVGGARVEKVEQERRRLGESRLGGARVEKMEQERSSWGKSGVGGARAEKVEQE